MDKERNKIIASNIKKHLKLNDMTQKELAEKIGISPSTISDYMNLRSNPSHGVIQRISDYFQVPKSEIDTTYKNANNLQEINRIVNIPVLGEIACGDPITAQENIEEYRERPTNNLPSGNLFYLKTKGDSMEPKIPDNSYVLIREQADVENGEIAAVLVNGDTEATLKKVRKLDDFVLLEAVNEKYDPYIVNEENPARILGKAVEVSFEL